MHEDFIMPSRGIAIFIHPLQCLFTYKPDVNIGRAGETKDTNFLCLVEVLRFSFILFNVCLHINRM